MEAEPARGHVFVFRNATIVLDCHGRGRGGDACAAAALNLK